MIGTAQAAFPSVRIVLLTHCRHLARSLIEVQLAIAVTQERFETDNIVELPQAKQIPLSEYEVQFGIAFTHTSFEIVTSIPGLQIEQFVSSL